MGAQAQRTSELAVCRAARFNEQRGNTGHVCGGGGRTRLLLKTAGYGARNVYAGRDQAEGGAGCGKRGTPIVPADGTDRQHRGETSRRQHGIPMPAPAAAIACGGDEQAACSVGRGASHPQGAARAHRADAHMDDVHAIVYGPFQAGNQRGRRADAAIAEDFDGVQRASRGGSERAAVGCHRPIADNRSDGRAVSVMVRPRAAIDEIDAAGDVEVRVTVGDAGVEDGYVGSAPGEAVLVQGVGFHAAMGPRLGSTERPDWEIRFDVENAGTAAKGRDRFVRTIGHKHRNQVKMRHDGCPGTNQVLSNQLGLGRMVAHQNTRFAFQVRQHQGRSQYAVSHTQHLTFMLMQQGEADERENAPFV